MFRRPFWPAAFAAALLACSSGGGGKKGGGGGGDTPDAGPATGGGGASAQVGSLVARGGTSTALNAEGRGGGAVDVTSYGAAPVSISAAPGLPAKPTWTRPAFTLGGNPRTIASAAALATAGAAILGDDGTTPATSLWVKPGATLTVTPVAASPTLRVSGPVLVEGTVEVGRMSPGSASAGTAWIVAELVVIAPSGTVRARGDDGGPGEQGGHGGNLYLSSEDGVYVFGTLDAGGGDGGAGGGNGGEIAAGFTPVTLGGGPGPVVLGGHAVFAGTVDASGGSSTGGDGGHGGLVYLGFWLPFDGGGGGGEVRGARPPSARPGGAIPEVAAHVTGTVRATGGGGTLGGAGGRILVSGLQATAVSGTLDASGGAVTGAVPGGNGGMILVGLWAGEVWCEGTALARGGDSGVGPAGAGGRYECGEELEGGLAPSAGVHLSADVDVSGGEGQLGGWGGDVLVQSNASVRVVADAVDLDASDATGTGDGGGGGYFAATSLGVDGGHGPVTVSVPVEASGSSAPGGEGGVGGAAWIEGSEVTLGAITADGGDSGPGLLGAAGGMLEVVAHDGEPTFGGPLAVRAGAGGVGPGTHGSVTVNGAAKELVDGVFTP